MYQITRIQICRTYHNNTRIQPIKQINIQYNLIETLFNHKKKAEQVLRILQTRKNNSWDIFQLLKAKQHLLLM